MWMFPQGNQPSVDRSALMKRAHLIARRFIGILPNNRACIGHSIRCSWADPEARQQHRERFKGFVPGVLTPEKRRASECATRHRGSSYAPFRAKPPCASSSPSPRAWSSCNRDRHCTVYFR
jgi:hypothetical protein